MPVGRGGTAPARAALKQQSPSGGVHYLFAADSRTRYRGKLCKGVEIKHQGYVLLAPSTFAGASYRITTDAVPAPAPDWVPTTDKPSADLPDLPKGTAPAPIDLGMADQASVEEVEDLLSWIDPDDDGYDAWIEILQALHTHFGTSATGFDIADAWSRQGARYKPGEVAAKWRSFRLSGGVTLGTLAFRARANGADLSAIARRHRGRPILAQRASEDAGDSGDRSPDLSHDHLALDLGTSSWDADARYVELWGKWLFWDGSRWRRDDTLEQMTRVRTYLRGRAADVLRWGESRMSAVSPAAHTGTPGSR